MSEGHKWIDGTTISWDSSHCVLTFCSQIFVLYFSLCQRFPTEINGMSEDITALCTEVVHCYLVDDIYRLMRQFFVRLCWVCTTFVKTFCSGGRIYFIRYLCKHREKVFRKPAIQAQNKTRKLWSSRSFCNVIGVSQHCRSKWTCVL